MMPKIKEYMNELVCILTGASPEHDSGEELLNDIDKIVSEISHCRRRFELVTDDDLIDAEIYEELALRSRYAYLMKKARAKGITGRTVLK